MSDAPLTIVALSGGVDSAIAAARLAAAGHRVECLHMSNWDDDDGYCNAAGDLQDARRTCDQLGLKLHRVSFADEYRNAVFAEFLRESRAGRTPNPDVLCNREIKFGHMLRYVRRLGGNRLATGHYARLSRIESDVVLLKGRDPEKDQSYFLHAVAATDLANVSFPLGELTKSEVRAEARKLGLDVADKRDSTGICFIGERRFDHFLRRFIRPEPGKIVTLTGDVLGEHLGLHLYTLGQRKGLAIGGIAAADDAPWYVAEKRIDSNELVVVQGKDHEALRSDWLETAPLHWIGPEPEGWTERQPVRVSIKTRYRQADQACMLVPGDAGGAIATFDLPQRAVTPGQYAVVYQGDRCLGGARIENAGRGAANPAPASGTG